MRISFVLATVLVCAACGSTSGVKVDEAKLQSLQKGKTTLPEATAQLGQPSQRSVLEDGRTMLTYYYVNSDVRPETLVPVVGLLVGGADTTSTTATLWFDKKGVLTGSSYSGGSSKLDTGVLNRSSQ